MTVETLNLIHTASEAGRCTLPTEEYPYVCFGRVNSDGTCRWADGHPL